MFFLREFTFCFIQQHVLDSVRRSDVKLYLTQITFTCSKLTIETLEKGVKHVQSEEEKHQSIANDVILVFLLTLHIFHSFF